MTRESDATHSSNSDAQRPTVVVVGGGICGLAAGHRLVEIEPRADVIVLEASARTGGLLQTERVDGCIVERGPDAIITTKPAAIELAHRIGIGDEIVSTSTRHRGAYVVRAGRLTRVPAGFSVMAPTFLWPMIRTPILSWRGKARVAAELVLPRGARGSDESLASFVQRRFGKELFERVAQPLASGIYGAAPERLSMRATMPRFLDLERDHRSVALGLRRQVERSPDEVGTGARYGMFVAFRDGMATLPDALRARLGSRVRTSAKVASIRKIPKQLGDGERFIVTLHDGQTVHADAVIVAVPAPVATNLVETLNSSLATRLRSIPHGSLAAVTLSVSESAIERPLDAFGFVVPRGEARDVIAATWSSTKWPGRAPRGQALLRVFLGGNGQEQILERPDDVLVASALRELRTLVGLKAPADWVRVDRYNQRMAQYEVGHLDRVQEIERLVDDIGCFALAGSAYRGVGIPDVVRSAEQAAERIVAQLRSTSRLANS